MVRGGGRGGAIKRMMIEEKPSPALKQDSVAQLPTMTVCVGCQTLTKRIEHLEKRVADLMGALGVGLRGGPHTSGVLLSEGGAIPISKETLDDLRRHLPLRGYSVRR